MPLSAKEWIKRFRVELAEEDFKREALLHLENIINASHKEKFKFVASFGGFLRLRRSACRISLTQSLFQELEIVANVYVAKYVMLHSFGEAAATKTLLHNFSERGSGLIEKDIDDARYILKEKSLLAEHHYKLYEFYCKSLKQTVESLKR